MKTKDRRKYFILIIMVIVMVIIIAIANNKYVIKKETHILNSQIQSSLISTDNLEGENIIQNEIKKEIKSQKEDKTERILTTYKGYPVIAKLTIPKIELETYVISKYSEKALGVSVTKFYGGEPNKKGNFCIAGHNYITKNMFHNLKKIVVGDKIKLTDLEGKCVEYKVYLVETVKPNETTCLSQKTNGNIELTLITCTSDSTKRIIVKAIKI